MLHRILCFDRFGSHALKCFRVEGRSEARPYDLVYHYNIFWRTLLNRKLAYSFDFALRGTYGREMNDQACKLQRR